MRARRHRMAAHPHARGAAARCPRRAVIRGEIPGRSGIARDAGSGAAATRTTTCSRQPPRPRRERSTYLVLAAFVAVLWFATLSLRPLFNTDEGRYAEIPREMLSGGDWVIPHLNGLAYVEKPPLQYWATAL